MKKICISLLILNFVLALSASTSLANTPIESMINLQDRVELLKENLVASTVAIQRVGSPGSGSGVIISESGLIMTAGHVIAKPGEQLNVILADGSVRSATALGVSSTDSGMAQIDAPGPFPFCPVAKEVDYEINDWVLAIGHPGGPQLGRPAPIRLGKIIMLKTARIVTSCKIISGDSGGPLFNMNGEVIGINSAISYPWNNNFHVSLDIFIKEWDQLLASEHINPNAENPVINDYRDPIGSQRQQAREILRQQALKGNSFATAYLERPDYLYPHEIQDIIHQWGELQDEEDSLTKESLLGIHFRLDASEAKISEISAKGPADLAGLKAGDIIHSLNGKKYQKLTNLITAIKSLSTEKQSTIEVLREGVKLQLEITPVTRYPRTTLNRAVDVVDNMMLMAKSIEIEKECFQDPLFEECCLASKPSVVEILRNDKLVGLGVVVSETGEILTKASLLDSASSVGEYKYSIRYDAKTEAAELASRDESTDLALIKTTVKVSDLTAIEWSDTVPTSGTLTACPGHDGQLLAHGIVSRPLHISKKPVDERILSATSGSYLGLRLDVDHDEPLVMNVDPQSPAAIAGALEGDMIIAANDSTVENAQDLSKIISTFRSGDKIKLSLMRGDKTVFIYPILKNAIAQPATNNLLTDSFLHNLSKKGGDLSKRRDDFPLCIYHDSNTSPKQCGGPLIGTDGKAYGINIARNNRFRSLALPASLVKQTLKELRGKQ